MEKDILIRVIETNKGGGNLGKAIKKAVVVTVAPPPTIAKPIKRKFEDDEWLIDALNWINNKCSKNIELVNVDSSNWFFAFGSFIKETEKTHPLEIKSVGGLVWVERSVLDRYLQDIRSLGKYVSVLNVSKGSTPDFYPELIFRYQLIANESLL